MFVLQAAAVALTLTSFATPAISVPPFELLAETAPAVTPGLVCGDRLKILEQLKSRHEETPTALGLGADGGLLEILSSPKGGFTILVTYPNRPTCVVAVGAGFELLTHLKDPLV
jgi:hypothetical protein